MTDFESKLRALAGYSLPGDPEDEAFLKVARAAAALAFEEAASICDDEFGNCVDTMENAWPAVQCAKRIRALSQAATGVK